MSRSTQRPGCGTAKLIGGDRCPIVDTWWQTETGAIMISPLPGVTAAKPGSAMRPLPGIGAEVVDDHGPAGAGRRRRIPRADRAVAEHAARHLGRRAALQATPTGHAWRHVLRRRRRQDGRGRGYLVARSRRRRDERLRPPHLHHRGRVGARIAPRRRRGSRRRRDRCNDGAGHRGIRHRARQRRRRQGER